MPHRHIPVARISAVAAIAVGAYLLIHGQGAPRWRTVAPGVEFTTLRGEPYCRGGSAGIGVLRIDPERVRLRVRHYTLEPERRPFNIVEWQRRSGALAVFNAGQFYPDNSYMGLLVCSGRTVSRELHDRFMAALVASPVSGKRAARVLDLSREPIDPRAPGWREVAQSFMLFDRDGEVRVRKSERVANRTLVGEDRHGALLVITTEGGYTLWDLAQLLKHAPIDVSHAMVMDGGHEAELCVKTPHFHYASFGHWDGTERSLDAAGALAPLPAVVSVEPE